MILKIDPSRRDPVRSALMQIGVFHGAKGITGPFVPITPAERDRLIEILEREIKDEICINCGCTKSDRWLKIMGQVSCCDARDVVPAHIAIAELSDLRAAARRRLKRLNKKAAA